MKTCKHLKESNKMSFPERLRSQLADAFTVVQKNRRETCPEPTCAYCKKTTTEEEDAAAVQASAAAAAAMILAKLSSPDGLNVVKVPL